MFLKNPTANIKEPHIKQKVMTWFIFGELEGWGNVFVEVQEGSYNIAAGQYYTQS